NGLGWIFGKWYGNNNPSRIKSYVNGTLTKDTLGLFQKPEHSVNYLESHDGYTLGDFIRLGLGEVKKDQIIKNIDDHVKLTPMQLKLNKLAALFLFTSRGITMIHSGQEFARSKVIPFNIPVDDPHKGMIDHNSYEKDNETNYINYNHAEINKELLDYYKGLIELRKAFKAFRRAGFNDVIFRDPKSDQFVSEYFLKYKAEEFLIILNADTKGTYVHLGLVGEYDVLVDENSAGVTPLRTVSKSISVPPSSGIVLKKK
ncbi:MAG: pullulanase, partial [Ignavibacteriaceae bacterium]